MRDNVDYACCSGMSLRNVVREMESQTTRDDRTRYLSSVPWMEGLWSLTQQRQRNGQYPRMPPDLPLQAMAMATWVACEQCVSGATWRDASVARRHPNFLRGNG